ncbi:SirB2 family protein [Crenobacter cavernae]|uniref:Regulator SirB n=1 Tax=Crenobacter cavernae TaxID=2290923 RepID=A0ABY0FEP7_9NEIS|nr:SirB2 family protein [Crenobacter cavernae]RXZ44778.1 regulator SirB [Crenobacter cavernae]
MNTYAIVKHAHLGFAALSIALFVLRGAFLVLIPVALGQRWLRVLPRVVDTLLLASGVALAVIASINPVTTPWLAAKLVALVAYIGFGVVALKPGRPPAVRATSFALALIAVAYIVRVAITKNALPF